MGCEVWNRVVDRCLFTMETKDKNTQETKKLQMGVMLFHLQTIPEIKLNASEVRDYKWVPLRMFFSGDVESFGYKDKDFPLNFIKYEIPDYIKDIRFPSIKIGMEAELWASLSSA